MANASPAGSPDIERTVLQGISRVERLLFGRAIVRNVRNKESRLYTWAPRYGIVGAGRLIVASLWQLPAILFLVVSVVLNVATNANAPLRTVSYVLLVLFLLCCVLGFVRAITGIRSGSKFRGS